MFKTVVMAAMLAAGIAAPADAHENFPPFKNLLLKADLATPDGQDKWDRQIFEANYAGLVYIDWHLQNFTQSEVFASLKPANGDDDAACQNLQGKTGKLKLDGRAIPGNNHTLVRMNFDLDRLPDFTLLTCEQVIGAGAIGLRIRGFFYAADHKVETARETGFTPVHVEPSRLPTRFFRH
jgi:hypothetical protein